MVAGNCIRRSLSPRKSGGELQGLVAGAGVGGMYIGVMTSKLYSYSNIDNQDRDSRLESSYRITMRIRKSVLSIDSRIYRVVACISHGRHTPSARVPPIR